MWELASGALAVLVQGARVPERDDILRGTPKRDVLGWGLLVSRGRRSYEVECL